MKEYLDAFQRSPILREEIERSKKEWEDIPNFVFSDIGRFLAENINSINDEEKKYIFSIIEKGMLSHDELTGTIMATFLLEAFYNSLDGETKILCRKYLGEESLSYIDEYYYGNWQKNIHVY